VIIYLGKINQVFERGLCTLLSDEGIRPLDGLRTLAILMVVAQHCGIEFVSAGLGSTPILSFPLIQGGWSGVDLFFVLSGFLIGKQLLREFQETGTVRVKRFILRRGLRIWPLYFFILALNIFVASLGSSVAWGEIWPELFFVSNYFGEHFILGSWSLSTEEMFYFFAPVLLVVVGKINQTPVKRMVSGLLVIALLAPMIRALEWHYFKSHGAATLANELSYLYKPFHTHFDGLIAGLLAATFYLQRRFLKLPAYRTLALAIIIGVGLRFLDRVVFNYLSLAMIFGALLWICLTAPTHWIPRLFSFKFLRVTSRLSYGLYLWYRPSLGPLFRFVLAYTPHWNNNLKFVAYVALVVAVNLTLCLMTYLLIEQPVLRWRDRQFR
jgi:peptidoglycan/LPS O-acetylase OafA/YrhL